MRVTIDLNRALVSEVLEVSGLPSLEAAVREGLHLLIARSAQHALLEMAGEVQFVADFDPEEQDGDGDGF